MRLDRQELTQELTNRTRAEEQRHVNDLYVNSKISREEWIKKTDELSDIQLWGPKGKQKNQNLQKE